MTTTRDDAAPSSSAPGVGEASAFPGVIGMRWWAVLLLALVLTAAGVAIDVVRAGSLGGVFFAAYPGGCILATLLAQRRDLFVPMVQPPLLLAVSVPVAVAATGSLPASGGMVSTALAVGAPLINGFPAMAITTVACVVIGLVRMRVQRWHRPDGAGRREPVRAGPSGAAARERPKPGTAKPGTAKPGAGKPAAPPPRDRAPSGRDERERREAEREQAERDRRRAQERARAERDREKTERERIERERREQELAERERARREPARKEGRPAPRGAPATAAPDREEPRPAAQRSGPPPAAPERDDPRGAPAQRSPGRAVPKSERPAPERPAAPAPAPARGGPGPRTREDRMREERLREEQERRGGPGQPPPGVHPVRERRPDDRQR